MFQFAGCLKLGAFSTSCEESDCFTLAVCCKMTHRALLALLQAQVGARRDEPIPWVAQLLSDFCHLKRHYSSKLAEMPDPKLQPKL